MKLFKLLLVTTFALTILTILAAPSTAAPPAPGLAEPDQIISGNDANKWPSAAVGNNQIHVAWSAPGSAFYGTRAEESGGPFTVDTRGSVGNNSTYFNAAVALGSDGTVHYAWISGGGTIYHMSKAPGQGWSGNHVVAGGQNFANTLNMTVRGNAEVFIAWRHQGDNPDGHLGFAYSGSAGVTWPIVTDVPIPAGIYAGRPDLAARTNSSVFVTWTGVDGRVYIGEWNGTNFTPSCVSCARPGTDFFSPSVAVAPDGRPFVAWRSVSSGVFYASRTNGQWGISNVFPYPEVSAVGISVDGRSNVHLTWLSKGGDNQTHVYYAIQKPGDVFSNPIIASQDNGAFKANVDIASCAKAGYTNAHIFYESFGGGQYIRYVRVRSNDVGSLTGFIAESNSESESGINRIYQNPRYFPMVTHPKPPTPTPTPTATPTPPPPPTC